MRRVFLALLRIVIGAVFIGAGVRKLGERAATTADFDHWGLPAPATTSLVISVLEIVCGLLILLGLATRLGALILCVDMLGAVATAGRIDGGPHLGRAAGAGAALPVLVARGGGRWQLLGPHRPAPVNLRLTLSYDGTGFRGWARQPGRGRWRGRSAAALDERYPRLAATWPSPGAPTPASTRSGRSSASRSARGPPAANAALALNAVLPYDVVVRAAAEVPDAFNARYSARARAYVYRVRVVRGAERARCPARAAPPRRARPAVLDAWAEALHGTHDFTAFTPTETQHRTFVRTVHHAAWHEVRRRAAVLIAASSFLRHQVRTLVGTMLLAARGERCAPAAELLGGAHRRPPGPTAPPHGLYLAGVRFAGEPDGSELVGIQ